MNTALLLSGGLGARIHTDVPKQYLSMGGRMLITCALKPLLASPFIDDVWIVAGYEWREHIIADAKKAELDIGKIRGFADPGLNRQSSILSGLRGIVRQRTGVLQAEKVDAADTVLVHDAARPFLDGKLIEKCYGAFKGHDGVMPVLAMKDTVYLSKDGTRVDQLLERSCIYAGQAPELFGLKKYYQTNLSLLPDKIMKISGSAQPAVMGGMDIVMIEGDESNFKITTETDMIRIRASMGGMEG